MTSSLPDVPLVAPLRGALAEDYERANEERRRAIRAAIYWQMHRISVDPLFEGPSVDVVARVILGENPAEIAFNILTRKEAAQWYAQKQHAEPHLWFWHSVLVPQHPELEKIQPVKHIQIMRWIKRMMENEETRTAMLRPREGIIAQQQVGGRPIDRLDEILIQDLHDGPVATIEAAALRMTKDKWDGPDELIKPYPWEKDLPEGVIAIRTFQRLLLEGLEMRHCIASYAKDIVNNKSIVLSIITPNGRSTASVKGSKIGPHVGFGNGAVPESCKQLVPIIEKILAKKVFKSYSSFDSEYE